MQQRMLPITGGKRTTMKLDAPTWAAVDLLSAQRGLTWQDWCRPIVEGTPPGENITATVRATAMDGLLSATVFARRDEQLTAMQGHPLMRDSAMLNDGEFAAIMKSATVQGESDFTGFTVLFGHDEYGQDCVWVRNGLRGGLHFAFIIPGKTEK